LWQRSCCGFVLHLMYFVVISLPDKNSCSLSLILLGEKCVRNEGYSESTTLAFSEIRSKPRPTGRHCFSYVSISSHYHSQ
jgi:hypothetical protein